MRIMNSQQLSAKLRNKNQPNYATIHGQITQQITAKLRNKQNKCL